jgi:hypothetical protein
LAASVGPSVMCAWCRRRFGEAADEGATEPAGSGGSIADA